MAIHLPKVNNDYVMMIQAIKPINKIKIKVLQQNIKPEINHTEEVIIGTEQGTTFPTKIGTSMCNALIDTGATKSCISERYCYGLVELKLEVIHLL